MNQPDDGGLPTKERLARVLYLEAALRKITKRQGRFDRERLTHCSNTVEDMARIAEQALVGTWEAEED